MRSLIAILILLGIAGVYFLVEAPEPTKNLNIIKSHCHFENGICEHELHKNLHLRFEFIPADLPAMEPFILLISTLSGEQIRSGNIKIWFEGRDMNMGQHFMLPAQDQIRETVKSGPEVLAFKGMIPVCTVDADMVWRLIIELSHAGSMQQIHFDIIHAG